jgi:hypothetical protein
MGSALGGHALRVAVKDRGTNDRMHTILMRALAELGAVGPLLPLLTGGG